jgi:hypothetical protein
MSQPIHFQLESSGAVYSGFLYPETGRFSLDCNGSFVGTGHWFADGSVHGLPRRHQGAAKDIAAALAAAVNQRPPRLAAEHDGRT